MSKKVTPAEICRAVAEDAHKTMMTMRPGGVQAKKYAYIEEGALRCAGAIEALECLTKQETPK